MIQMNETNEYVMCMRCQGSFHMNECEPFGESGVGIVYCPKCLAEIKAEESRIINIGHCPYCNSENVEYGSENRDGLELYFPMLCLDCHKLSREYYDLNYRETIGKEV